MKEKLRSEDNAGEMQMAKAIESLGFNRKSKDRLHPSLGMKRITENSSGGGNTHFFQEQAGIPLGIEKFSTRKQFTLRQTWGIIKFTANLRSEDERC